MGTQSIMIPLYDNDNTKEGKRTKLFRIKSFLYVIEIKLVLIQTRLLQIRIVIIIPARK